MDMLYVRFLFPPPVLHLLMGLLHCHSSMQELFAPVQAPDGTFVFAAPIGDGHAAMIALADIGFFARYTFDNRELTSGKDLEVASEVIGWEDLAKTFTNVTGQKAIYLRLSLDEWSVAYLCSLVHHTV